MHMCISDEFWRDVFLSVMPSNLSNKNKVWVLSTIAILIVCMCVLCTQKIHLNSSVRWTFLCRSYSWIIMLFSSLLMRQKATERNQRCGKRRKTKQKCLNTECKQTLPMSKSIAKCTFIYLLLLLRRRHAVNVDTECSALSFSDRQFENCIRLHQLDNTRE